HAGAEIVVLQARPFRRYFQLGRDLTPPITGHSRFIRVADGTHELIESWRRSSGNNQNRSQQLGRY
ncbi:MAG TPA: hypothetical protein VF957_18850, partial [Bradyrhizobium sp.]